MSSYRVPVLPTSTSSSETDAVSMTQVEKMVCDAMTKAGTLLTGLWHLTNQRCVDARDATLKMYVDKQDALIRDTRVLLAGDTMVNNLDMGCNKVIRPPMDKPTSTSDAASV